MRLSVNKVCGHRRKKVHSFLVMDESPGPTWALGPLGRGPIWGRCTFGPRFARISEIYIFGRIWRSKIKSKKILAPVFQGESVGRHRKIVRSLFRQYPCLQFFPSCTCVHSTHVVGLNHNLVQPHHMCCGDTTCAVGTPEPPKIQKITKWASEDRNSLLLGRICSIFRTPLI